MLATDATTPYAALRHRGVASEDVPIDAQSNAPSASSGDGAQGRPSRTLSDQEPALLQRGDLSDTLAKTVVTSSKDAIGLLFQAAEQHDTDSRSEDDDDDNDNDNDAGNFSARRDGVSETTSPLMYSEAQLPPQLSEESLALWKRHRFVVQGWFSAVEAISYLQL